MYETLVVSYFPSGELSRTKRLLDAFLGCLSSEYYVLDLLEKQPNFLTPARMQALVKRHYEGKPLTKREQALVARTDDYLSHLHRAQNLVLAYPMHNFSMPAIVKAFFDTVIIKGETFDIQDGRYEGLMKGKRGLAISTCGGSYNEGSDWSDYEHCFSLQERLFEFMGFDGGEVVSVQGCDELPKEEMERCFETRIEHLCRIAGEW